MRSATSVFARAVPITVGMGNTPEPSAGSFGVAPLTDRRRRPRLKGETAGWLMPSAARLPRHGPTEEQGWEVLVHDVSRLGVGFETSEPLRAGTEQQIRIGRGPLSRARQIRVVCCRPTQFETFAVGAEFVHAVERAVPRAA